MSLYQIHENRLSELEATSFRNEGILERRDLQSFFRVSIEALAPDMMVLAEEFGNWEDSRRRIDLLCLDTDARLVVVELKRTDDGGHMDLQAIRYAAMVARMTFSAAVEAHRNYLKQIGGDPESAEAAILSFLGWDEPEEENFASDVRLVLASGEFSKELMTAVIWLNERELDITCVRLKPYKLGDMILLDVQQIFPLPEASDYQIKIREKESEKRKARTSDRELVRYELKIGDQVISNLPKLRLAHRIISEAVARGNAPRDVVPWRGAWIAVEGQHDSESFLQLQSENRDSESSTGTIRAFLTADDELILSQGKTYALRGNMWGHKALAEIDRIIGEFDLSDAHYEPQA